MKKTVRLTCIALPILFISGCCERYQVVQKPEPVKVIYVQLPTQQVCTQPRNMHCSAYGYNNRCIAW
jgi:PBP1b-binding outer membrane lipoprotein LpoB